MWRWQLNHGLFIYCTISVCAYFQTSWSFIPFSFLGQRSQFHPSVSKEYFITCFLGHFLEELFFFLLGGWENGWDIFVLLSCLWIPPCLGLIYNMLLHGSCNGLFPWDKAYSRALSYHICFFFSCFIIDTGGAVVYTETHRCHKHTHTCTHPFGHTLGSKPPVFP